MFKYLLLGVLSAAALTAAVPASAPVYGLVLHGGAGVIRPETLPPGQEAQYRAKLQEALDAGYAVLEGGGSSVEAVIAVITILEDSPLFNAGKGAVFNADGICELDASIMDGRNLAAGAIAGVQHVRNPILLARAVMEKSEHVMLTGAGAEAFAKQQGFELVPNEYFHTELRRQQLEKVRKRETTPAKASAAILRPTDEKHGTVGCVALDRAGNLAAGTSTGGMTNKKFGRVGDSPIIGAGTYASNATCAISATGWGEYFIRLGVARDIAAQMEYRGTPLAEAAAATIAKVGQLGGDGGVICLDRAGNIAMPFNTVGMYRAFRLSNGETAVKIGR
ncbi:isoaspartyl peptidase/L-asparaginase [Opitutus sp. ER46]|uniref:isoaspartyl peptidase/L-asparaginase family protein n=1 Tax=Opitutus sp. ER46 TaxID=2161864 RepID=UPI000D2F7958|nr:isoaspartyl peptidase/L-asparaginase [Opitutus sp. ER46]PTX94441.1 beta-aspartyl-peptidase [Opitutus sp. ER46]